MVQHFTNPSAQLHLEIILVKSLRVRLTHKRHCRLKAKESFVQVDINDSHLHKDMASSLQHDILIKFVMLVGNDLHASVRS